MHEPIIPLLSEIPYPQPAFYPRMMQTPLFNNISWMILDKSSRNRESYQLSFEIMTGMLGKEVIPVSA